MAWQRAHDAIAVDWDRYGNPNHGQEPEQEELPPDELDLAAMPECCASCGALLPCDCRVSWGPAAYRCDCGAPKQPQKLRCTTCARDIARKAAREGMRRLRAGARTPSPTAVG